MIRKFNIQTPDVRVGSAEIARKYSDENYGPSETMPHGIRAYMYECRETKKKEHAKSCQTPRRRGVEVIPRPHERVDEVNQTGNDGLQHVPEFPASDSAEGVKMSPRGRLGIAFNRCCLCNVLSESQFGIEACAAVVRYKKLVHVLRRVETTPGIRENHGCVKDVFVREGNVLAEDKCLSVFWISTPK
ncbi:hypothetical protein C8R44DRAFT_749364 [Mycena epipterygia]|nr:hypothetical protein C8R44DRAFT_749364 [Mycena epipterygia]